MKSVTSSLDIINARVSSCGGLWVIRVDTQGKIYQILPMWQAAKELSIAAKQPLADRQVLDVGQSRGIIISRFWGCIILGWRSPCWSRSKLFFQGAT